MTFADLSLSTGIFGLTRRAFIAPVAGVLAALFICAALTADHFGGMPGLGRSEMAALGAGGLMLLLATVARYAEAGGLAGALRFFAVIAQLGLGLYVIRLYEIESPAFHQFIFPVVLAGFIAFHFLPRALRPHAFLALSLAVMIVIMGIGGGLLLLACGLVFIGLCHLPVPWWLRITLILALGGVLAAVRASALPAPSIEAILPILASIFMFRLVIYIYDIRNGAGPTDWASRLSYFFMLPNFVFPFFPVVDFTQWGRSQTHDDNIEIYQRGAMWIFYGILHLLLYRAVNYYLAVGPDTVENFGSFMFYVVTNYALYLKISGIFHMILGCLFMFGYALPETHGRYYLSSSFIELWRRVNIYWKDFMQKLVFNPAYMMFKKRGTPHRGAVVRAIVLVFIVTWWTHAYQWFWLVGSWLLTVPDTLFWMLLGGLLIVQTLENDRPPKPNAVALIGPGTLLAIQTFSMMTTLTILWALWSCQTMAEWWNLLERGGVKVFAPLETWTAAGIAQSVLILGFFFVIGAFSVGYTFGLAPRGSHPRKSALRKKPPFRFEKTAMHIAVALGLIALIQAPGIYGWMPRDAQLTVLDMRISRLSDREQAELELGYYENLTAKKSNGAGLMDMHVARDRNRLPVQDMNIMQKTGDALIYELKPDQTTIFRGGLFTTNSAGMRDREYPVEKPEGTTRIALLGASRAMGWGVNDDEVFDALMETGLTERLGRPVEILNFAVADYEPARRLLALTWKAGTYDPDVVLFIAHSNDFRVRKIARRLVEKGTRPHRDAYVEKALVDAGVEPGMPYHEIVNRLQPFAPMIVENIYKDFVTEAHNIGARPVWVYLPSIKVSPRPEDAAYELQDLAERAGFLTINLDGVYKGLEVEKFWLNEFDRHPNAAAHHHIAEVLTERLLHPDTAPDIGLGPR